MWLRSSLGQSRVLDRGRSASQREEAVRQGLISPLPGRPAGFSASMSGDSEGLAATMAVLSPSALRPVLAARHVSPDPARRPRLSSFGHQAWLPGFRWVTVRDPRSLRPAAAAPGAHPRRRPPREAGRDRRDVSTRRRGDATRSQARHARYHARTPRILHVRLGPSATATTTVAESPSRQDEARTREAAGLASHKEPQRHRDAGGRAAPAARAALLRSRRSS